MATQQPNDTDCSDVDGLCPLNCQNDNLNCFLIDNNGFILVSKASKQTSKFLGEVDGSVMTQLISMGMFKQVKMYDYQAMCKMPHHHHSGARPLLSPVYALLGALKWLITDFLIFFLEFNISGFWHTDNLADAKAVFHHAHKHKKHDMLQPCDTEYPVFVYEPAIKETNGIIECGDCQKMFVVQQITNSNLLLLVVDAVCDCSNFPPVLLQPKEVKYIFLLVEVVLGCTSSHVGTCLLFIVAGTHVLDQNHDIDAQDTNRLQGDLHWGSGVYVCGGKSGYLKNLQGRTSFKDIHMKL
ncbi:Hypothetical predicted protein [Podarcis lilfordi]|uniref:Voltage-dependent calcium channel alpha-2/delta subunit conserved region domain-containing protein n=1 Tax=Podarcis lilfordi TaxID=74358 RepID=A0AA35KZ26_9SAUR|nr:Hypothetical predicted protein [Podarcis lilfordi]